jgi:hypothetical protein
MVSFLSLIVDRCLYFFAWSLCCLSFIPDYDYIYGIFKYMKSSLQKGHTIKWPREKGHKKKKPRNGRQNKKQKSKDWPTRNISYLHVNGLIPTISACRSRICGEWAKRTSHKLHILSSRLIFFSIIHIQMTCLSFSNQT